MKKIDLKYYSFVDDKYIVRLGNGHEYEFKQERQAKAFLVKTSKYLTEQLNFSNHIFTNVILTYRQNYLLFSPNSGKRQADVYQAERDINDFINAIHKSLEKAIWMGSTNNGNYIVFSAFYYVCYALRNICANLNVLAERQKLTSLKYQLSSYQREINLIETSLNEFEQMKAVRIFERARYTDIESINMAKVV
ncbi:hypothetical protein KEM09_12055 [Carboxylicivirga mesophila]|uniref:Uncharacterized protein n=1 Tax=Carboxylicivirga mesophila TaxID=1166478 RepID=A0ABS5KAT9_9BACT|nr:hypothetical protein [Carboxylicivirga mesophila]MBS2212143.1 hypothetical protein [Carboxylicivirga mesophila]